MQDKLRKLCEMKSAALLGGGKEKIAKRHEQGRLTARERVERLLDPSSFIEQVMLAGLQPDIEKGMYGDGVVTGYGRIDGRRVCIFAQDATFHGGSTGPVHRSKICSMIETALETGVPLIGLNDSAGGRMEPTESQSTAYSSFARYSIFYRHIEASGVVPQISAIMGPCAGNGVYAPALTDFIFVVKGISQMFITGPRVLKEVTGEETTQEELGGAKIHCEMSGVADVETSSEDECLGKIRELLSLLPSNNRESPPVVNTGDDPNRVDEKLENLAPTDSMRAYDMHNIILRLVDSGYFFEIKPKFARNVIVGFGRLNSRTVGIVANQPLFYAGTMTIDSSDKQARFIRFCDAFNIPLVFLIDTPGYLPGREQERGGLIRHGAKALYALGEATVPKVAVVIGKCYGGARPAMGADKDLGADRVYAWPTAESSIMGPEPTAKIIYRKAIASAKNPEEFEQQKIKELKARAGPYNWTASEWIDDVIEPRETRRQLIGTLEALSSKRELRQAKKHGNIPL